jgi:hypothetical protein
MVAKNKHDPADGEDCDSQASRTDCAAYDASECDASALTREGGNSLFANVMRSNREI